MADIMIDLETLGTKPGSVILSIGAVVFDPRSGQMGETFYRVIDRRTCQAIGLTIDSETVDWWLRQSQAARDALMIDQRPVQAVLDEFTSWWKANRGARFWAHGPNFDETLLTAVYRAAGLTPPWKYWDCRCTRTIYAAAGDIRPDRAKGVHHNALDDAQAQARAVIEAYRILGLQSAGQPLDRGNAA